MVILKSIPVVALIFMAVFSSMVFASEKPLNIKTEANGQVFIEPARKGQNRVLVKISDPTAQANLRLAESIRSALKEKGYRITENTDNANFIIQGNVIRSGEVEPELLEAAYKSPFGARFRVIEPKADPIAKTVGLFFRAAKGKSYAIIVDLILTEKKMDGNSRQSVEKSRCRIIAGVDGSHLPIDQTMPKLREYFKNHVSAYF